jgi:hypothetical protein
MTTSDPSRPGEIDESEEEDDSADGNAPPFKEHCWCRHPRRRHQAADHRPARFEDIEAFVGRE